MKRKNDSVSIPFILGFVLFVGLVLFGLVKLFAADNWTEFRGNLPGKTVLKSALPVPPVALAEDAAEDASKFDATMASIRRVRRFPTPRPRSQPSKKRRAVLVPIRTWEHDVSA